MILSTNENMEKKFYIEDVSSICKKFIEQHDLKEIPCGKYLIDGENLYVNIVSYETKNENECMWEAHREYLDIHYIIEGNEKIRLANINEMLIEDYIEDADYVKLKGDATSEVNLKEGDFLILFLEDAHMTGCFFNAPQLMKKAIFKVNRRLVEK